MMIEQEGADCVVTIYGETKRIKNCKALKLANTMWNKEGEKYTKEEMDSFGLVVKEEDFSNDFHKTGGGGERQ